MKIIYKKSLSQYIGIFLYIPFYISNLFGHDLLAQIIIKKSYGEHLIFFILLSTVLFLPIFTLYFNEVILDEEHLYNKYKFFPKFGYKIKISDIIDITYFPSKPRAMDSVTITTSNKSYSIKTSTLFTHFCSEPSLQNANLYQALKKSAELMQTTISEKYPANFSQDIRLKNPTWKNTRYRFLIFAIILASLSSILILTSDADINFLKFDGGLIFFGVIFTLSTIISFYSIKEKETISNIITSVLFSIMVWASLYSTLLNITINFGKKNTVTYVLIKRDTNYQLWQAKEGRFANIRGYATKNSSNSPKSINIYSGLFGTQVLKSHDYREFINNEN